jgi:hypothetical protein
LGPGPKPPSPNPQSPIPNPHLNNEKDLKNILIIKYKINYLKINYIL